MKQHNANISSLDAQKKKEEKAAAEELAEAKKLKEVLDKMTVELIAKAGEGGRLFGSITTKQIAEELQKKHGIKIDKRKMELEDAIRTLGVQRFLLNYHEVTATLTVHVKEGN